jgi:transposase
MKKSHQAQRGPARTKRPERHQVEMQLLSLDQWLSADHRVRTVWRYVDSLDLSELYESIQATEGNVGRDAIDPRILFALWLFATLEGETSARRIAKLTERDIPYKWICGGVSVNYHKVSDFRTAHGQLLERILIDSIAVLIHNDLVTLSTVSQDGMRVRASAGSGSFRRESSLAEAREKAQAYVDQLNESGDDPSAPHGRREAAQQRAAQEKLARLEQAQAEMADMQAKYRKRSGEKRSEPRASTTDPEARRMKMADGGTRPALNVQFANDGDAQMVIAVQVTSQGSDSGLMGPMYEKLQGDYRPTPQKYLVDGGFTHCDDITRLEAAGTQVYAPLYQEQKQLEQGKNPYAGKPGDSLEMAAFRVRMGTPEAKEIYKRRSAIAEFPNADCRNRGLTQFRVRGLVKAKAQTLWHVLAFNFTRMLKLNYLEVVIASG